MQLVQRWWNGLFGRLARRDIWLEQGTIWRVRARQGDGDGRTKTWTFETRDQAEAMIQRLLTAQGPGEWKDITAATAASFPTRDR